MAPDSPSTPVPVRRREKRRHDVSPSSVEIMRDPMELLSLAVRVDESSSLYNNNNEAILEEPLERGRLYCQEEFHKALTFLNKTKASSKTRLHQRVVPVTPLTPIFDWLFPIPSSQRHSYPKVAITPIILSGLIAAQSSRQHDVLLQGKSLETTTTSSSQEQPPHSSDASSMPSTSELILHCMTMRRAALQRVRWQKSQRKIRRYAYVVLLMCGLVAVYVRATSKLKQIIVDLGYGGGYHTIAGDSSSTRQYQDLPLLPCVSMDFAPKSEQKNPNMSEDTRSAWQGYKEACLASEANLWANFRDFVSPASKMARACQKEDSCSASDFRANIRRQLSKIPGRPVDFEFDHAPYAMHTIATREERLISYMNDEPQAASAQDGSECEKVNQEIRWLGESTVNGIVRTILERNFHIHETPKGKESHKSSKPIQILDVGCGVGGTLYSLPPSMELLQGSMSEACWLKNKSPALHFRYHGISISPAEVLHARILAADHGINLSKVRFDQMSFDDPSLADSMSYSAVVAIESLSFSRDVQTTLSVLSGAMQSGALLIVVDDVAHAPSAKSMDEQRHQSTLKSLSRETSRPSLLTNDQWLGHFDETGFVVEEIIDLGLHYDLPQLIDERPVRFFGKFSNWIPGRQFWFDQQLRLLQVWEAWMRGTVVTDYLQTLESVGSESSHDHNRLTSVARKFGFLRYLQVFQGHFHRSRGLSLRREAHSHGDLTYNMYICTKR